MKTAEFRTKTYNFEILKFWNNKSFTILNSRHLKLIETVLVMFSAKRVVRDIVVVLRMSTSWTPMLVHAGSILSCASMRLGVPADWLWLKKIPHH